MDDGSICSVNLDVGSREDSDRVARKSLRDGAFDVDHMVKSEDGTNGRDSSSHGSYKYGLSLEFVGNGNDRCVQAGRIAASQEGKEGEEVRSTSERGWSSEQLPGLQTDIAVAAGFAAAPEWQLVGDVNVQRSHEAVNAETIRLNKQRKLSVEERAGAALAGSVKDDRRVLKHANNVHELCEP